MKAWGTALTVLVFIALLGPSGASRADGLRVVASIKPVHSLVAAVMKGAGEPALLVNGAGSPHAYALRPSEARFLSRADIVFWVGPDFELFLQKPLRALAPKALSVALMDQPPVTVLSRRASEFLSSHEHSLDDEHGGAYARDGHIWLDPVNAIAMVQVIARSLQHADAANAGIYADNAAATISALENLDTELRDQLDPVQTVPFVVFHDAFQYFEKRYGLNTIGSVVDTPEQITSAKYLKDITAEIERRRPACIYAEPSAEPGLVKMLMEGAELRLGSLDPEGISLPPGVNFYFNLMRKLAYDFNVCLSEVALRVR
jgi:zinc transport system substrate-binding protein